MFWANPSLEAATYRYQDLGTLSRASWAGSINRSGQVVGWSLAAGGIRHALVWTATGGMQDLNNLVTNPPAKV